MMKQEKPLYTLIPLDDFKAIMGVDEREDKISRYCLTTATYTIEQYCMRRLLRKKHFERIEFTGDLILPLKEYPVSKILVVFLSGKGEILEPDFYHPIPDCSTYEDIPFSLSLSPALNRYPGLTSLKAVYWAGYAADKVPGTHCVPPDLASACLELAAWNMNRYKGRRIGMTGNVRGNGKDGEHLEMSMPENVRLLLEPYRRKVI
jgi:hypothetical protein